MGLMPSSFSTDINVVKLSCHKTSTKLFSLNHSQGLCTSLKCLFMVICVAVWKALVFIWMASQLSSLGDKPKTLLVICGWNSNNFPDVKETAAVPIL